MTMEIKGLTDKKLKDHILQGISITLNDNPFICFDDSIEMPSVNNRIKEFNNGEPIWEDMSKDELTLDDASLDDIMNLDWEIERQIEKDEKLMEKCSDTWY